MMYIHTTIKEDFNCSPAELVFGQDLRLRIEASAAQGTFRSEKLDKHLQHCRKVLVCNDAVHRPLASCFSGSLDVIKKCKNFFVLKASNSGMEKFVSLDRLKTYHSLDESTATSENTDEENETATTLSLPTDDSNEIRSSNTTSSTSQYVSSVSFIIAAASTSFSCYSTTMYDSVQLSRHRRVHSLLQRFSKLVLYDWGV